MSGKTTRSSWGSASLYTDLRNDDEGFWSRIAANFVSVPLTPFEETSLYFNKLISGHFLDPFRGNPTRLT